MGDRWGVLEWLVAAVPFTLPALVVWLILRSLEPISPDDSVCRRAGQWTGRFAFVLLGYAFGWIVIVGFVSKPYFASRLMARSSLCQTRLKNLSAAFFMYAQDWNDCLPPASHWGDRISRYLPPEKAGSLFRCPSALSPFGFALNRHVAGLPMSRIEHPDETVMLLETDTATRNAIGDRASLPKPGRHTGTNNVALMNGRAMRATSSSERLLIWKPGQTAQ